MLRERKKNKKVKLRASLKSSQRRPLYCSHDCPQHSVSRSQSAFLCCSVLFTLFVVLNLIVINIFDLLCIWRAYIWRKKNALYGWCFILKIYLLSLYSEISPSPPVQKRKTVFEKEEEEAKVQFYCTGAKSWFCVDNQWCLGLKSQTNKRYLRWRDLTV